MSEHRISEPLVSILTPSYNQGRWLRENIQSVDAQTYASVEQVVVDGGSTDSTMNVLASAGPRTRWVSEADHGQSHALNKAYSLSRGSIIGWLNSDDAYFHRSVIAGVVDVFLGRPDIDVVYGHAALVNADGLVLQWIWVPRFSSRLLRRFNFIVQPSVFVRRSALGDRIVDETFDYSMDRALWLALSAEGRRFFRVDDVLAIDRHHPYRKSYTRMDLGAADARSLEDKYALPRGRWIAAEKRVRKVMFRWLGLRLILRPLREPSFGGRYDGRAALAVRQLLLRRGRMPVGEHLT